MSFFFVDPQSSLRLSHLTVNTNSSRALAAASARRGLDPDGARATYSSEDDKNASGGGGPGRDDGDEFETDSDEFETDSYRAFKAFCMASGGGAGRGSPSPGQRPPRGASCPPRQVHRRVPSLSREDGGAASTPPPPSSGRGRREPPYRRMYQREERGEEGPGSPAEALTSQAAALLASPPQSGGRRASPYSDRGHPDDVSILTPNSAVAQLDVSVLTPDTFFAPEPHGAAPPSPVRPGLGGVYFGGSAVGTHELDAPAAPLPPPSRDGSAFDDLLGDGVDTNEWDAKGRCVRHTHVRLRKRKVFGGWRVLMSACPGEFLPFFASRILIEMLNVLEHLGGE